jgi:hypothetical protein
MIAIAAKRLRKFFLVAKRFHGGPRKAHGVFNAVVILNFSDTVNVPA